MAKAKWFEEQDKHYKGMYEKMPKERSELLGDLANKFATLCNMADLSGLESEVVAFMCFGAIHLSCQAYENSGYGELNNCRIVSQLQPVLRAMTQEQRDEMQAEIAKVGEGPVVSAFTALMVAIKELDKEAKAG